MCSYNYADDNMAGVCVKTPDEVCRLDKKPGGFYVTSV